MAGIAGVAGVAGVGGGVWGVEVGVMVAPASLPWEEGFQVASHGRQWSLLRPEQRQQPNSRLDG